MRPSDVLATLEALLPLRRPIYFWGPPGVGKSSLVHQAAAKAGLRVLDLRAVLLDPVDLRGLPVPDREDNCVHWMPPAFLPIKGKDNGGPGVIFADELAQASQLVQSAFLQGIFDHRIGEIELDPEWTWIAASNRQEDRSGAHRVITALLNRFATHIDLEVSVEDWQAWAAEKGIAPEVRSFINWKPSLLFQFDPASGARAFPTPRSWKFASDLLQPAPAHLLHPIISGCIGEGPAAEFVGFVKIYRDLPDIDAVLANPKGSGVPKEPSVLFATCGALVEKLRGSDKKKQAAFFTYISRMPAEFSVLAARDAGIVAPGIYQNSPEAAAWCKQHRDLLLGSRS